MRQSQFAIKLTVNGPQHEAPISEYSHQDVITWMHHNHLTLDTGSDALGISRRMLAYYRCGQKPVPKAIGLAMVGWESLHKRAGTLATSSDSTSASVPAS
jgi:hypothetical protein